MPDNRAALKFIRTSHFDEYTADELSHLAAKALLPEKLVLDTALETIELFYKHWQAEKTNLPLSGEVIQAIDAHLKIVPIAGMAG